VLRIFSGDCGAKNPELLTSTRLGKQIVSLAQVVSLKENELDSLATFMGHDLRVHTQFYRLPLDVMQITRISKLFLAAEKGKIAEFAGKHLSFITVSDNDSDETDSKPDSTAEQDTDSTLDVQVGGSIPEMGIGGSGGAGTHLENKRKRAMTKRQKWTEAEKDAVRSHFCDSNNQGLF